jgi:hypothetical protein
MRKKKMRMGGRTQAKDYKKTANRNPEAVS